MDERPWYSGFFDDDYLRVFGPVLPEERTAAEVNGVVGQLGVAPGARLLDLCCGPGRHAVPLARLGQGQPVGLVAADMRRLPFADASFDALRASRDLVRLRPAAPRRPPDHPRHLGPAVHLTELAAMLDRAGLELLAVSGDLDGGPLELDSSFVVAPEWTDWQGNQLLKRTEVAGYSNGA